jgi:hypothetical protein
LFILFSIKVFAPTKTRTREETIQSGITDYHSQLQANTTTAFRHIPFAAHYVAHCAGGPDVGCGHFSLHTRRFIAVVRATTV